MSNLINFQIDILNSQDPVIAYFGSSWCGPCIRQIINLEKFAENTGIKVFKIDIDSFPDLTSEYKIRSVPTMMLFKSGKLISSKSGLTSVEDLEKYFIG